jgi:hypothetical protein
MHAYDVGEVLQRGEKEQRQPQQDGLQRTVNGSRREGGKRRENCKKNASKNQAK